MTGVKNFFMYWSGEGRDIIWDREDNFSQFIDLGSHRGASHQGTWTGCLSCIHKNIRLIVMKMKMKNRSYRYDINLVLDINTK